MSASESFSRGFDRGNYGNAYESTDWEAWQAVQSIPEGVNEAEFRAGMLLGFFSSYELTEVEPDIADEIVALLKSHGAELLAEYGGAQ